MYVDGEPARDSQRMPERDLYASWERVDRIRALSIVRLATVAAVFALGLARAATHRDGDFSWRAALPPLFVFTLCASAMAVAARSRRFRDFASFGSPFMDLLLAFAVLRRALPLSEAPHALAGAAVGIFACIVVLAAVTQGAKLIAAMTLLGIVFTALLQRDVGMPPDLIAVSGLMLAVTALVTSWSALRLERLSGRLVREEVARSLAVGRGEELERWNQRVTALNAELEEQHARLLVAQRESETMMGLVVHDMKQPLASIQGLVEVVADHLTRGQPLVELLQADLAIMRGQSERLLAMIADLLAIARLEKGSMTARKQPARLKPFLSAVVEAHLARAHGVAIAVRVDDNAVATVDHELVQRMIENLLANALSFTRPGDRIEISVRLEGPHVEFAVKNSGPPVPPEVQPLLFEKLVTRAGRARHNAGLGLYFCRLVAEAHGGRISLEPDPDFRVAFVVRLPAAPAADTPPESNRLTSLLDVVG